MNKRKRNAIVVMAIGKKYQKDFSFNKKKFYLYAKKIDCDLIICDRPPDEKFKRSLMHQRMLLPSLYDNYEWIASLDMDLIISYDAPSIFDYINTEKGFGAFIIPRHSEKWKNGVKNYYEHSEEILKETHKSYFQSRNFPEFPEGTETIASINDGVTLFNTKKVSKLFKEAYFSDFVPSIKKNSTMIHRHPNANGEAFVAYLSQVNNLFFSLPEKFNNIVLYNIFEDLKDPVSQIYKTSYFKLIRKIHGYSNIPNIFYPKVYRNFLSEQLKKCYFLAFHGNFPYKGIKLKSEL
jgi:hypothetical protein